MVSRTDKFRGSRTHGRGKKSGRGAGKHGGTGNAGLHKHKAQHMLKYMPDHFGRHGFKRPPEIVARPRSVNVGELDGLLPILRAAQAVTEEGGALVADLSKLGIDRLLGAGVTERPWKVVVPHATKHAREKVTVLEKAPAAS